MNALEGGREPPVGNRVLSTFRTNTRFSFIAKSQRSSKASDALSFPCSTHEPNATERFSEQY
jgi:hypothetical protein